MILNLYSSFKLTLINWDLLTLTFDLWTSTTPHYQSSKPDLCMTSHSGVTSADKQIMDCNVCDLPVKACSSINKLAQVHTVLQQHSKHLVIMHENLHAFSCLWYALSLENMFFKKKINSRKKQAAMCNLQILPPVFPFQFASTSFKLWRTSLQSIYTQFAAVALSPLHTSPPQHWAHHARHHPVRLGKRDMITWHPSLLQHYGRSQTLLQWNKQVMLLTQLVSLGQSQQATARWNWWATRSSQSHWLHVYTDRLSHFVNATSQK